MDLGIIITQHRKEKQITQQELADFIGVSKAAVSKWETGQTCPDINLLPLLAAYFDISIDTLLGYNAQLTSEEIRHIYKMLTKAFDKQSGAEVLKTIRGFIQRYYACYPFILQMGLLIMNHYDLFPGQDETKISKYMQEAQTLFVHVRKNAKDPALIIQARDYEAYTLLVLEKPEAVLDALGAYVPPYFPTETLIAGAFRLKNDHVRARRTLQSALAQYVFVTMSLFSNYLAELMDDADKFNETYRRGQKLAELFELETLHPVSLLNFQASAIVGFAQLQAEPQLFEVLNNYADLLAKTQFPLQLHGDVYFDLIQEWLDQLDLGAQMPRNSSQVQAGLIALIINNPYLAPYQNKPEFQEILQKIKSIGA
ncbi:helix-turn-helix domain-containing protein [Agrilactobacillus yilanensis]|uniref:Helix-turn-helix domain-containing protein n=1 Tax=Agrilactobacillus yilanensis TaxID=2485997 RepID=A0ABW4J8J5_9LACO|nr:helix-turn-helix transcriptional regulator [Agrilactobacillus yilanensis]